MPLLPALIQPLTKHNKMTVNLKLSLILPVHPCSWCFLHLLLCVCLVFLPVLALEPAISLKASSSSLYLLRCKDICAHCHCAAILLVLSVVRNRGSKWWESICKCLHLWLVQTVEIVTQKMGAIPTPAVGMWICDSVTDKLREKNITEFVFTYIRFYF